MSFKSGLTGFSVVVNFFLWIGEGGEVFVGRVGGEETSETIFKEGVSGVRG